jgi:transcriptional regulator with XRE-family HTH domain
MAANRSSPLHEATLQASWLLQRIGRELRLARIAAGATQQQIALRIGTGKAQISRAERAAAGDLRIAILARHASVVGVRLSVQLYPGTRHVLDTPQLALLELLRTRLDTAWSWQIEVPMPAERDLRAVDALLRRGDCTIAVEAITRLSDVQAQVRAAQLKRRDIGATRLLLLIGGSRANRRALAQAEGVLRTAFLTGTRHLLGLLAGGNDPGGDLLLVL